MAPKGTQGSNHQASEEGSVVTVIEYGRICDPEAICGALGDRTGLRGIQAACCRSAGGNGSTWRCQLLREARHVREIFSQYSVPESVVMAGDVTRLKRHLAGAAAHYDYDSRPPEWLVNRMGYMQLRLFHRPEQAVELGDPHVELFGRKLDALRKRVEP